MIIACLSKQPIVILYDRSNEHSIEFSIHGNIFFLQNSYDRKRFLECCEDFLWVVKMSNRQYYYNFVQNPYLLYDSDGTSFPVPMQPLINFARTTKSENKKNNNNNNRLLFHSLKKLLLSLSFHFYLFEILLRKKTKKCRWFANSKCFADCSVRISC